MYIVWGKKWSKWEIVDEGEIRTKVTFNALYPGSNNEYPVVTDTYRRMNNKTGIWKYKTVERK